MAIFRAALASTLTPVILLAAWWAFEGSDPLLLWTVLPLLWVGTVAHVALLGVPAFVLLRRLRWLGGVRMALVGWACGALPLGLATWPGGQYQPGSSAQMGWHGRWVTTYRDGLPTLQAWLIHAESAFMSGMLGAACALVFWCCWRQLQRDRDGTPPSALVHGRRALSQSPSSPP